MEAAALTVLLHAGGSLSWRSWTWEPSVLAGLALASAGYGLALARGHPAVGGEWWRPAAFAAGILTVFLALQSPLDTAGDEYLLSLHMLQHMLLAVAAPALLLLGLPPWVTRRAIQFAGPAGRAFLAVARPYPAAALFTLDMWLWHVPGLYQAALASVPVHVAMHLAFLGTGALLWWPVIDPLPEAGTLAPPAKALYLFVTGLPMALLALVLLASPGILYSHYAAAPRLWGIGPLTDQQIAGLIMGALGETGSFIAFALLFLRFSQEDDIDSKALG